MSRRNQRGDTLLGALLLLLVAWCFALFFLPVFSTKEAARTCPPSEKAPSSGRT